MSEVNVSNPTLRKLRCCKLFTGMKVQYSSEHAPSACTHLFRCAASNSYTKCLNRQHCVQLCLHQQAFQPYLEEKSLVVGSRDAVCSTSSTQWVDIATCSTRTLNRQSIVGLHPESPRQLLWQPLARVSQSLRPSYIGKLILALPQLWVQKCADLRAHDVAHSPDLWHQPRLAKLPTPEVGDFVE
jgi:hypothetical protein